MVEQFFVEFMIQSIASDDYGDPSVRRIARQQFVIANNKSHAINLIKQCYPDAKKVVAKSVGFVKINKSS